MHEVGIMQSTLTVAATRARASGASRIHEIRLRVGRLTGVVPESLQHAFTVLREGTLAGGAQLAIDFVNAVCWCAACQKEFETADLFSECPVCSTPSNDIRHGLELELVSLEVD